MKITVMDNGMVKVEGATLAEEVEMRNKLQAQGKICTPIEYEGSAEDCIVWLMGKSEGKVDVADDIDADNFVLLTDEDGQELEIEYDEIIDYLEENIIDDLVCLDWSEMEEAVENYLWERPEITEDDFYYLIDSGQVEELVGEIYSRL